MVKCTANILLNLESDIYKPPYGDTWEINTAIKYQGEGYISHAFPFHCIFPREG